MDKQELEKLRAAYNAVFDENGQMRTCGRKACIELITLMEKYTTEYVGNKDTGQIEVGKMRDVYLKLIG